MHASAERVRRLGIRVAPPLAVGAAAVAGSFAAAGLSERFIGGALATLALDVFPPVVFALGITWLGPLAAPLLVATTTLLAVVAFAVVVELVDHVIPDRSTLARGVVVSVALASVVAVATGSPASAVGSGIGGAVAFVAGEFDREGDVSARRRGLLRSAGVLVGILGLGGVLALGRDRETPASRIGGDGGAGLDDDRIPALLELAEERSFDLSDAERLVSDAFYKVDITLFDVPSVDPADWSLRIHGAVERELELDFDEVTALPAEHRFVTLRCVSDELNGHLIDTALWTGTPLAPILDAAGASDHCCVRLAAADGYYQAFPRAALEQGFLAWGMNGARLPERHGAPVRVLIPGHWGEINVKWLEAIEIRDEPATGYWEERGWHGTGPVETVAKLHSRRREGDRVVIGGHAYAGVRGVRRAEVSTDGGATWAETTLSDPLPAATPVGGRIEPASRATDAWRMWRHEYDDADRHEVTVRAYERDGTRQPRAESEAYPSGATGWVSEVVPAKQD